MRFEVTVREMGEVAGIASFLAAQRITKVNINHVRADVNPVDVARELLSRVPGLDLVLHLSVRKFAHGSIDTARAEFRCAFEEAKRLQIKRILVVSGHPRQTFETTDALRTIQMLGLATGVDIFCAYNPFFDPARQRDENERLRQKLTYPFVKAVCMQIGMDTEKLKKAVEFIRSIRPDITLFGEVPVPSDATLQRLKLAALYGVFLPNCYFLSASTAEEMTKTILEAYTQHHIEPVIFSAHLKDFEDAMALFGSLSGK
jgi:5,10-methylenetetrahydrofolate reductase